MSKRDDQLRRMRAKIDEEIVAGDDGYAFYWPRRKGKGGFSSEHLRIIADILDDINKEHDARILEYFKDAFDHKEL